MTTLPGSPPAGGPELGVDTMDLLRFATIGSVDDGKSTLIGRLLFDTRQLFDDQLTAIETASERRGLGEVDLSFVTDGLRAEREQGITIDVAYRYAATPHRKFVIADCPGHIQYTRNMATGASTADLALVLVDATTGLQEQSRRHICIAALLGGEARDLSDVTVDLEGVSDFNRRVYAVARGIRPGATLSYGDFAERLGDRNLARDVAQALSQNTCPIVIPCHRVLAAGGKTGGFSAPGGVQTKLRLLSIEGAQPEEGPMLFDRLPLATQRRRRA